MDYKQQIIELQTKIESLRLYPFSYLSKEELLNSITKMCFFPIDTFYIEIDKSFYDSFNYITNENIFKKTNRVGWYGVCIKITKGYKLTISRFNYRLDAIISFNNLPLTLYTRDYSKTWLMPKNKINSKYIL